MFEIIGNGFGRYGYQLAFERLGLPSRVVRRGEEIAGSEVVIAVPPKEQPEIARDLMLNRGIKTLMLEKPLAETPQESLKLLSDLKAWGGKFRIGYLFSDTVWANRSPEFINWTFTAHHFAAHLDDWKRRLGVIRMYGIHLIAHLCEIGFDSVSGSLVDDSHWLARFKSSGGRACIVYISTNHDRASFRVDDDEFISPWGWEDRVEVLARSIQRFLESPQPEYGEELILWQKVEAA